MRNRITPIVGVIVILLTLMATAVFCLSRYYHVTLLNKNRSALLPYSSDEYKIWGGSKCHLFNEIYPNDWPVWFRLPEHTYMFPDEVINKGFKYPNRYLINGIVHNTNESVESFYQTLFITHKIRTKQFQNGLFRMFELDEPIQDIEVLSVEIKQLPLNPGWSVLRIIVKTK